MFSARFKICGSVVIMFRVQTLARHPLHHTCNVGFARSYPPDAPAICPG
jgi:hypothetical protein